MPLNSTAVHQDADLVFGAEDKGMVVIGTWDAADLVLHACGFGAAIFTGSASAGGTSAGLDSLGGDLRRISPEAFLPAVCW